MASPEKTKPLPNNPFNKEALFTITSNNAICENTTQNFEDLQAWIRITKHLPK